MPNFSEAQIEAALDAKSAALTSADIQRIADGRRVVENLIAEFPEQWEKARKQALLLLELIEAGEQQLPLEVLKQAAGALIYLGSPLDLVPDDEADGYADDAAVIALAIQRLEPYVKSFCAANGRNELDYLG